jgi:hypothetical protein
MHQTEIALFWLMGRHRNPSPATEQHCADYRVTRGNDDGRNARLFALLNIAG